MCFEARARAAVWLSALATILVTGCAGAPAQRPTPVPVTPELLYPLAPGQAWSYDVDTGDGQPVLAVSRVVGGSGDEFEVQSGGGALLRYARRPDGWYRPARGGYLLRAPLQVGAEWDSGSGMTARITAIDAAIETPAGHFERCVVVQEQGAPSGQQVRTTYCPGVGPAEVVSEMQVRGQRVSVVARLRGFTQVH